MRITSEILTVPTLRNIAASLDMYLDDLQQHDYKTLAKRDFTMKLRSLETNPHYRAYNPITGRNLGKNIPCWHGFRDFYAAVYNYDSNAIIVTGGMKLPKITYHGLEHFNETHEDTGYINIGSQIYPFTYLDSCNH